MEFSIFTNVIPTKIVFILEQPIIQGDVFECDRSEVFAPVDVVVAHSDPELLLTRELSPPLTDALLQCNWR